MHVRFWGVRGSVPWATFDSIGHGCNTPCVEVRDDRMGALLVLDAGSGIVGLGHSLGTRARPLPILLTHYHWDHTQGLPFFSPFFQAGWAASVWAPVLKGVSLESVETIFGSPYFPVPFDHLPSRPQVRLVNTGSIEVGGFRVSVQALNHPGGAFAYRIHGEAGDVVYATDHEFGNVELDEQLAAFCADASALISDAHFTPEELPRHQGWGHASWRQVAEFASRCRVGHLWLFHHKPGRTDSDLVAIEAEARRVFHATGAAKEGVSFEI
jgi:phosphoribosyl 1,2-cyclic phosphodiesterase